MRVAVIYYPGTNDDCNVQRAVRAAGMEADIVMWNKSDVLDEYDGFILPGGWSYEDRIRAGVIAAKQPMMQAIKDAAKLGKPVLGICNGAQILIESGMIPGLSGSVEMALAPNRNPWISGYYCTWTTIKSCRDTAFSRKDDAIIQIPIAHGEGRFVTKDKRVLEEIEDLIAYQYCNPDGEVEDAFPTNPNGSYLAMAGLANKEGNVLAMMPHPERASWSRQVPGRHSVDEKGHARVVFENMKRYMEDRR